MKLILSITIAAMSLGPALADQLVAQLQSVQPPGWTQEDQERLDERERARWELRKTDDPVFEAIEEQKWRMEHRYLLQQLRSIEERRQPQMEQKQQRMLNIMHELCCFPLEEKTGPWYLTPPAGGHCQ